MRRPRKPRMYLKCYACDASIEVAEGASGTVSCPACGQEREIPAVVTKSGGQRTSLLAVSGCVLGLLFVPLIPALLGMAALVAIRDSQNTLTGRWMARLAVVLGLLPFFAAAAALWVVSHPQKVFPRFMKEDIEHRQDLAARALLTIAAQQLNFRSEDHDRNEIRDWWTADVAGLYVWSMKITKHPELVGLDIARADAAPLADHAQGFEPRDGYVFRSLGDVDRMEQFAFTAYPKWYGYHGVMTYYVDERRDVWQKDLGGLPADRHLKDPPAEGWTRKY